MIAMRPYRWTYRGNLLKCISYVILAMCVMINFGIKNTNDSIYMVELSWVIIAFLGVMIILYLVFIMADPVYLIFAYRPKITPRKTRNKTRRAELAFLYDVPNPKPAWRDEEDNDDISSDSDDEEEKVDDDVK